MSIAAYLETANPLSYLIYMLAAGVGLPVSGWLFCPDRSKSHASLLATHLLPTQQVACKHITGTATKTCIFDAVQRGCSGGLGRPRHFPGQIRRPHPASHR